MALGLGLVLHTHRARRAAALCEHRLHTIFTALELYEAEHGVLPTLDFFAEGPRSAAESPATRLAPFGVTPADGICPGTPKVFRAHGMSYLWNARMNHRKLCEARSNEWLMVEANALDPSLPRPHGNRYHVLMCDGHVVSTDAPPAGLVGP